MGISPRRTRYRLPDFEAYGTLRADAAAFDKVQVRVRDYALPVLTEDTFNRFLFQLGQSEVFVRASNPRSTARNRFQVRGGEGGSRWLFNANLTFRRQGSTIRGLIDIWLNPMRFAAHRGGRLPRIRDIPAHEALLVDPDTVLRLRSWTLDGSDNMIHLQTAAHPPDWIDHATVYFEKVRELIDGEVTRALDVVQGEARLPANRWGGLTLSHAEVAWEFRQPQAVTYMHRLAPRLRAIADELEVSIYGTARPAPTSTQPTIRHRTKSNAVQAVVSVLGEDRRKIGAVFYAKEHDRLRLEIRYERNVREILGSTRLAGIPFTFEHLPQYLREVRTDARERMNAVLSPLDMEPLEEDEDHRTVFELVGHVASACGERTDLVAVVLELLVMNGGISVTNDDLAEVVAHLEEGGIVRCVTARLRNRGALRFCLNREYLGAASKLTLNL